MTDQYQNQSGGPDLQLPDPTQPDRGPTFTLHADDPVAPMVLRLYASLCERLRTRSRSGKGSCGEMWTRATEMEAWYERMYGRPHFDPKS